MVERQELKADRELTKAMKFQDPRSFIGKRIHPETNHQCVYLKGRDVGPARLAIYERDKELCKFCGRFADWDDGEMHHVVGGLGLQRCSCPENLVWSCGPCHQKEHGRFWRTARIAAA